MGSPIEAQGGHTPGPWVVESDGYYPVVRKRFRPDHHMDICGRVHGYMYSKDEKGEQAANARLIAASPDLLEPARDAIEILEVAIDLWNSVYSDEPDEVFTDLQRRFREALAKATGGAA